MLTMIFYCLSSVIVYATGDEDEDSETTSSSSSTSETTSTGSIDTLEFGKLLYSKHYNSTNYQWSESQLQAFGENACLIVTALLTDGYTEAAAAGALNNFLYESNCDPYACEGNSEWQSRYIARRDNGTTTFSVSNSDKAGGCGIGQWTYARHKNLSDYCKEQGNYVTINYPWKSSSGSGLDQKITYLGDTGTQMAFLFKENTWNHNESRVGLDKLINGLSDYKLLTDPTVASKYWTACWEVPGYFATVNTEGGHTETTTEERAHSAVEIYNAISGKNLGSGANSSAANSLASQMVGYWSEEELSTFCKLTETNYASILASANRSNLTQNELESLNKWMTTIEMENHESGVITLLRRLVVLLGILLIVYSIFFYIAYWFDRLNTVFDLNLVGILTLGKLTMSDDPHKSTFGLGKKADKMTVNHKDVLFISLVGIFFGTLIVSGGFYLIIQKFVNYVLRLLKKV
jgi:hypothetical protein